MKIFHSALLLPALYIGSASSQLMAQHMASRTHLESGRCDYAPRLQTSLREMEDQIPQAKQTVVSPHQAYAAGKTSAVTPIKLGSASNALSWIRNAQNQLVVDNESRMLAHIHRQDVTIWGGGITANGRLRYDISIDGGANFNIDVGEVNPIYSYRARYPQVSFRSGTATTNPLDKQIVWSAAVLNSADEFDGMASGVSEVATSGTPASTENYDFIAANAGIPSGLSKRVDGEYWMVDLESISGTFTGNILVLQGNYDAGSSNVIWFRTDTLSPSYHTAFDGDAHFTIPTMEWSPDGADGWISMLADITGDTVFSPVFWHTTDGGSSWSGPISYYLGSEPWVADTLKSVWTDSLGNPAATGKATTAFDHDITVDIDGNVHMGVVIGSASTSTNPQAGYSLYSSLGKFFADVYTTDGGSSWQIKYMAPVLTLRGEFGGASGSDPLVMDNNPQAARNADGSKVFFTWADSDTNTVGFGESANLAPNLRGVSWRVADGFRTCYKRFTDGDILWGDQALFPAMAPTTLRVGLSERMFTGFISFQIPGDELQPTDFYTLVNDTWFDDSEYFAPECFTDMSWNNPCICESAVGESEMMSGAILHQSFPNPTSSEATIAFELGKAAAVQMVLTNIHGQQMALLANGQHAAGMHKLTVNTSDLTAGIYFYTLRAGNEVITKKLTVAK